jgi:hypothetical protein
VPLLEYTYANTIYYIACKKSNKSIEEVESIWHKSKQIAKEKFKEENDDYWKFVTYLTKRQCNESLSFKEFLNNKC